MGSNLVLPRVVVAGVTQSGALTAGRHTVVSAAGGAITMTLPAAAPANAGAMLSVEKSDPSANAVTITGSIRGATTTISLTLERQSIELVADANGSWYPTAGHTPKTVLDGLYTPASPTASISRSVTHVVEPAGNSSYSYAGRIRPIERRRSVRVVNIGSNPFRVGYSSATDNANYNNPGSYAATLTAGQEFLDTSGNPSALFISDTSSTGVALAALVIAETYN